VCLRAIFYSKYGKGKGRNKIFVSVSQQGATNNNDGKWEFHFRLFVALRVRLDFILQYYETHKNSAWICSLAIHATCLDYRNVPNSLTYLPLRTVRPIYRKGVPLPSRCCILYIFFFNNYKYEYFKHAAHSVFLFKMPFIS
jgi:hypothetical protein